MITINNTHNDTTDCRGATRNEVIRQTFIIRNCVAATTTNDARAQYE